SPTPAPTPMPGLGLDRRVRSAEFQPQYPVVTLAGLVAAIGVVRQHPQRSVGGRNDVAQTSILLGEVLLRFTRLTLRQRDRPQPLPTQRGHEQRVLDVGDPAR